MVAKALSETPTGDSGAAGRSHYRRYLRLRQNSRAECDRHPDEQATVNSMLSVDLTDEARSMRKLAGVGTPARATRPLLAITAHIKTLSGCGPGVLAPDCGLRPIAAR